MAHSKRRSVCQSAGFIVLALGGLTVCAQGAPSKPAPEPEDTPNLLAGPDVGEPAKQETLVTKSLDGGVQKLAAPPSIAALKLLELTDETRARIAKLLEQRAAIMDTLVLGNIELLSQVETVMAAGSPSEKFNILREGLQALGPVRAWGKLETRIAEALPREQRSAYRQQIREYEKTRYERARQAGKLDGKMGYRVMRHWEDMGWEIERAAERVFESDDGDAWMKKLVESLDLTPDQAGKIRAMGERFYIDAKGRPTEQQQMAFIAKIRTVMTTKQKWKFTGMMLRGELDPEAME